MRLVVRVFPFGHRGFRRVLYVFHGLSIPVRVRVHVYVHMDVFRGTRVDVIINGRVVTFRRVLVGLFRCRVGRLVQLLVLARF